jgi:hypothetical protein
MGLLLACCQNSIGAVSVIPMQKEEDAVNTAYTVIPHFPKPVTAIFMNTAASVYLVL